MKVLLAIVAVLIALSVIGFVIKTLFWLGVTAAVVLVGVAAYGAIKGSNEPHQLR
ncbi:hypothetical protein [Blastococcus sp. Marseille-P5729]|uniref:hypothetical protein n=1 Tax=Blastococcus sp. Marseille-P5729 TaxID=2086582 RepID=UPI0018FE45FA|nr:hypothetical protein [Blastococcus sp. Marseille-P5729]